MTDKGQRIAEVGDQHPVVGLAVLGRVARSDEHPAARGRSGDGQPLEVGAVPPDQQFVGGVGKAAGGLIPEDDIRDEGPGCPDPGRAADGEVVHEYFQLPIEIVLIGGELHRVPGTGIRDRVEQ